MSRWTLLQVGLLGVGLTALPLSARDNPWRTNTAVEAAPMPRVKHGSIQVELRFDLRREAPRAAGTSDCGTAPARLAGTWYREMPGMVAALSFKHDELTLTAKRNCEGTITTSTMTAEFALTKDGTVHGVFTGADVDVKGNTDNLGLELAQMSLEMQGMIDQPFAFRCRPTEGGVMVSNLRFPDPRREMTEELALLCGKYTFAEKGTIPSPKATATTARAATEPSYPERYGIAARAEVVAPFAAQVAIGSNPSTSLPYLTPVPNNAPPEVQAMMLQTFGQMMSSPASPPACAPSGHTFPMQTASPATYAPSPMPSVPTNTMPKGTWVREVGALRYKLELKENHLTATATFSEENDGMVASIDHILTVDCYPTRNGSEVVGLITGFDMTTSGMGLTSAESRELMKVLPALQKALGEKPIAFTFRIYDDALVIGNVRFPSIGGEQDEMTKAFEGMAGRYKANAAPLKVSKPQDEVQIGGTTSPQYYPGVPTLPMPPPKPLPQGEPSKKLNPFRTGGLSSDPNVRIKQLLYQSEDHGIGPVDGWRRFWFNDRPSHMTPERIHGGIF